ncbi:MAG: isoaspartyl peptidase/L-asparaginase family protein [Salinivirgaceae bacterium]
MTNHFQFKHAKPYFFILGFLLIPLLLVPFVRFLKNNSSFYAQENAIQPTDTVKTYNYGLVIHGGAGNFLPEDIPSEQQAQYKAKLYEALALGISNLDKGDSALQVVIQVIKVLEDSPLFNAGKGAVFTHEGTNELDASIMDGHTKNAGAVAGVKTIKNPITAAYQVMVSSNHVLLTGKGAETFAKENNIELVDPEYFYTEKQWNRLQRSLNAGDKKMGTVGCVVLDSYGNLAAGTSTGGMTNKRYGRVGDSPIIGAGTYADNASCAISATGHGEFFIRYTVAYDIAARMKYLNLPLELASKNVISELKQVGGEGGIIGIDKNGNISMQFNTTGMFRGYCLHNNDPKVLLFN